MKILSRLERAYEFWLLLALSTVFFLLRLPSLAEPYWYGDEGIYYAIAMALQDGKLLYGDVWDNKPPLLYILYTLFSSDQFFIRFVSLLFGIATIFAFFFVAKNLLKQKKAVTVATIFFAILFGLPTLEGNIANAENFMLLPITTSAYLFSISVLHANSIARWKNIFAGILLGLAFLIKIVAVFDLLAFATFYFFLRLKNKEFQLDKLTQLLDKTPIYLALGFLLPFAFTLLFFAFQGNIGEYINAIFFRNISYVGKENVFLIPQGLLILKLVILVSSLFIVFLKRSSIPQNILFIVTWFIFALFSANFSGRPYTHYLLLLLPAFCLGIGMLSLLPKIRIRLALAYLVIIILLLLNFDFYMAFRTIPYYINYVRFLTNTISLDTYRASFDRNTPRDYNLASYLKSRAKKEDLVYLWGDSPQVYKLADKVPPGKYTVAYHVVTAEARESTVTMIEEKKPRFIVIFPNLVEIPFSMTGYQYTTTIQNTQIYERIN